MSNSSHRFGAGRTLFQPLRQSWNNWKYRILARSNRLPIFPLTNADRTGRQIAFADVFRQLQQRYDWFPSPLYAVGGAADPAFLSILTRCLVENDFKCVFEFGAGLTTQILAAWANQSGMEIFTFEDSEFWASKCQSQVSSPRHHVIYAPLIATSSGEMWYDLSKFEAQFPDARADLFVVDGPMGTQQRSRAGIIPAFPRLCRQDWAVIWDDVDRYPDLESLAAFVESLRERAVPFEIHCCQAFRTQALLFTNQYQSLKHYC